MRQECSRCREPCTNQSVYVVRPVLTPEQNAKQTHKSKAAVRKGITQTIPPCACGAPRVFEFQLLSSLLHVLEVDKYSNDGGAGSAALTSLEAAFAQSGMNFGNIAVYTCSKDCGSSDSEYVVVQDSVDDAPIQRIVGDDEPVVIAEGTKFEDPDDMEDDDDDAMDDGGDDDDNDDAFEELNENDNRV